ncbi:MAG: YdeI/OmpD-associated family protein [Candidatus Limnocylindrales bacterium]
MKEDGAETAGLAAEGTRADGKPWVHPLTRAAWRAWLIANHETSSGVHLVTWRKATGKPSVAYGDAVEEALCVGWVDSIAGKLDDERSTLWFTKRRPKSGWSRPNKERVERLLAADLMLPAGLAAIEEAKRRGTWSLLDDVEDLVVPQDLTAALAARPPARANWDAFSRSARRGSEQPLDQNDLDDVIEDRLDHAARERGGFLATGEPSGQHHRVGDDAQPPSRGAGHVCASSSRRHSRVTNPHLPRLEGTRHHAASGRGGGRSPMPTGG